MSKITDFRKALNAGKKNLEKVKTISAPVTTTFFVPDAKGNGKAAELEHCLKSFSVGDMLDLNGMQTKIDDDKVVTVMTSNAAVVIVGVVDKDGKRIFSEDDGELLDCPLNTMTILSLSLKLLSRSGADTVGEIEVK